MSSFHFYRRNQFKVIPLACTLRTRNLIQKGITGNWVMTQFPVILLNSLSFPSAALATARIAALWVVGIEKLDDVST